MAWIERHGEGWRVCWRERGRRRSLGGFRTERDAQVVADEAERAEARGETYDRERRRSPKWAEAVTAYVDWYGERRAAAGHAALIPSWT